MSVLGQVGPFAMGQVGPFAMGQVGPFAMGQVPEGRANISHIKRTQ